MATYQGRIMARSPFYITASGFTHITSATLKVWIWNGDNSIRPTDPTATISKNGLTTTSTHILFDIGFIVRDYFEHSGKAYSQNNDEFYDCVWVETELDVVQTTAPNPATVNNIYLGFDGYSEYKDGVNYSSTDLNNETIYAGDSVKYPLFIDENSIDTIETYSGGVLQETIDLTSNQTSTLSYDHIYYLNKSGVDKVLLKSGTTTVKTITIQEVEACQFDIKEIRFINKDGLLRAFPCYAKSSESITSKRENYKSDVGSIYAGAYNYNSNKHQYKDFNTTGRESIKLNTGWIKEEMNYIFKEMLRSEYIWVDDLPVNLKTDNFDIKTRKNDGLINYTFDFDYAFDFMNNV